MWVVKLGGSVFDSPHLPQWLDLLATRGAGRVVVVPGGGRFADAVRAEQQRLGFDDPAAHDMALLAMVQAARMLHSMQPALRLVDGADAAAAALRDAQQAALWQPFDALGRPPRAPHSGWDITSDSLAAALATQLGASQLVLVKWIEPPPYAGIDDLVAAGYVDRAFAGFARGFGGGVRFVPHDGVHTLRRWLDAAA